MTIGTILLGVALFGVVSLFIARPFLRPQEQTAALTQRQLLLEEKEALLDQLQALDFDHDTGKIPTLVHERQRASLVEQATAVLQALDAPEEETLAVVGQDDYDVDVDIEIEAAVTRLRQQRSKQTAAPAAAATPANGRARFCPQCGTPTDPGDRFCANCGHNLTLKTSTKTA